MTEHEKIIIQTVNDYIDALKKKTNITGITWEPCEFETLTVTSEYPFHCLKCDQDLKELEGHTCVPKKQGYEFL